MVESFISYKAKPSEIGNCYQKFNWMQFRDIWYVDMQGKNHKFAQHDVYDETLQLVNGTLVKGMD